MNRQNPIHKPVSSLRRQHSMKTEEYLSHTPNTVVPADRTPGLVYRPHSGFVASMEVSPTSELRLHNRPDHSGSAVVPPASLSPRYLTVLDHGSSAHSSLVAVSRVSQQPSFESYDSSVSAVSWTSSNDPDGTGGSSRNTKPKTGQKPVEDLRSKVSGKSDEKSEVEKFKKTESDTSLLRRLSRPREILRLYKRAPLNRAQTMNSESNSEQVTIEAFRTASQSPTIGRSRRLWGFKLDRNESVQQSSESIKVSELGSSDEYEVEFHDVWEYLYQGIRNLKVIGLKKENPNDMKSNASAVAPNMKGLWKRAFQSLRKDKNERDSGPLRRKDTQSNSADNQSSEGEVDPVYHLLRCAASKSQSAVSAASGVQTPRSTSKVKSPNAESTSIKYNNTTTNRQRPTRTSSLRTPRNTLPFY